jgi:hypothetical protein
MLDVRPTALIGMLALGLALGSIVIGQLILAPQLRGDTALVDANLARALTEPLVMRAAEITLAACLLLVALAGTWLRHRAGTTLGLLAIGLTTVDRFVLLPRVHEAWARVDLVAMRPHVRVEAAEQLELIHEATLASVLIVLLALAALASVERPRG